MYSIGILYITVHNLARQTMHLFATSVFVVIVASLANSQHDVGVVSSSSNDFEVELGMENDDYFVKVTCITDDWTDFPAVNLKLSSVAEVIFEDCSFPTTLSLQSIIDSMKIKVEKKLTFKNLLSSPSRQNLKGISVPDIEFDNTVFNDLPYDLLYEMSNLHSLRIDFQVPRIPDSFFADWAQNISVVDMSKGYLSKINKNDFFRLINLKNLNLFFNAINEIEPKAFDSLINLNTLNLVFNPLHTLPLGIFDLMTSLVNINLSYTTFDYIPPGLLKNNKNLEEFTMDGQKGNLTTLPRGFFKNLIHLKAVSLKRDQWKTLPSDLFVGCFALVHIDLSNNQLVNLPPEIFDDAKNLELLNVGGNRLESLPAGIFKGLGRLKRLFIDHNKLTSLTSETLEDLESLEFLDASYNRLTRINDQFVTYLKSANHIDLSYNQLTFDGQTIMGLSGYYKATSSMKNLSDTFINVSEKQKIKQCSFNPSVQLKHVILSHNKITQFSTNMINIIKYSKFMNLSYNSISKISLFKLSSQLSVCNNSNANKSREYPKIYMDNNPLHCDCDIQELISHLKYPSRNSQFHISATKFDSSGKGFKCASPPIFKNREILDLSTEELDCSFKTTTPGEACTKTCICRRVPEKGALSVDCSNKNLTRIPPLFDNTQNWFIELNMSSNNLQQSPSLNDAPYSMNVTSLDLSNNNIPTVTLDLFTLKLQHLKLHGNRISRLDSNILEHLEQNNVLLDLTLHNNKWICDCEAREFVEFVQKKFTRFYFHEMKCYGTNKKLYKMTVSELCEDTITIIVIASLSIVFFATVIAMLIVLYYKYQREIKVWLYSKQWCLWFVTEDELDKDKEYDAFISFSHKDEDFVKKEIVANLEVSPRPYKLCLHYRDWLAGEWIPIQISRSVEASRRTIIVLTPSFLESVWGLLEFRTAHTQALKDGRNRLIVIIYEDIGNIDDLDQEMQDYLRLNTYIKWSDPWFWKKLRYALPHSKQLVQNKIQNSDIVENHLIPLPLIGSVSDVTGEPNVVSVPSIPHQIST